MHILRKETLISAVTEEIRRYMAKVQEPFNFDFVLLVVEKDTTDTSDTTVYNSFNQAEVFSSG